MLDAVRAGARLVTVWGPRGAGTTSVALEAATILSSEGSPPRVIERAHQQPASDRAELRARVDASAELLLATSTEPLGWPGERCVEVTPLRPVDAEVLLSRSRGDSAEPLDGEAFGGLPKLIAASAEPGFAAAVDALYEPIWRALDERSRESLAHASCFEGAIDPELLQALLVSGGVDAWSLLATMRALGIAAPCEDVGRGRLALTTPFRKFVGRHTSAEMLAAARRRYLDVLSAAVARLLPDARADQEARACLRSQRCNVLAAIEYATDLADDRHVSRLMSVFHELSALDGLEPVVVRRISPWLASAHAEVRESALVARAMTERFRGEHHSARRTLLAALASLGERGATAGLTRITAEIAKLDLACGRAAEAQAGFDRASAVADDDERPRLLACVREHRAMAAIELGNAAHAALDLEGSISLLREAFDHEAAASQTAVLARAHAEMRRPDSALALLASAMQEAQGWQLRAAGEALRARLLASLGECGATKAASRAVEAAEKLGRADQIWHCGWVHAEVDLLEGRVPPLALLEALAVERDRLDITGSAALHLERLRAVAGVVAAAPAKAGLGDSWVERLLRIHRGEGAVVEAELAHERATSGGLNETIARLLTERVLASRANGTLRLASLIGRGGRWFARPGAARVDLQDHPSLARFLGMLVAKRQADVMTMFHSTWPGDAAAETTARKRVQVVASRLRKLGLSELSFHAERYSLPADAWWICDVFENSA